MYPELFKIGSVTVYSYGFFIALGAIAGVVYMAREGKRVVNLSFDQANSLFLLIFLAAVVGGKIFLFFENPHGYIKDLMSLLKGRGFVFYGSFLFSIPTMLLFFKYHKLDSRKMLDVMAVTTCLVHFFGRLGCFMAGCCHGEPTDSSFGISFTNPACYADPKGIPLHPTQLYEAGMILLIGLFLLFVRNRKTFDGQLFLYYLILYAMGRFFFEFFRGDDARGFVFNLISHAQLIALLIVTAAAIVYFRWSKNRLASMTAGSR